ncbi:MAG: hypothetical protein J4432_02475 [DPANN group archaeon]|nr:hypothetical protein [DPANN group archaeon]
MVKTLFKNENGSIHYGRNAPEGFIAATKEDVATAIANLGVMKLWRCTVCNDMHIGMEPPEECPTCGSIDAYVEINEQELKMVIGL